jgi:xanthine dehydrogenase accessory factor
MRSDVSRRAAELSAARVPYVSARVVLAERPTSARPGDEALVLGDGTLEGFVGGNCAESTVRSHALALLDSGETLLLRITPTATEAGDVTAAGQAAVASGRTVVHNPCLSGGTLEIFLEPVVPAPLVLVLGTTPIARALLALGGPLGYDVRPLPAEEVSDDGLAGASALVVASHGRDEEDTLLGALRAGVPYIGLVASPKRGAAVVASLDPDGSGAPVPPERISTPAGLDIGARTPEEVALSILAELVARRPRPAGRAVPVADGPSGATAIDPVCGMTVAAVESSLHLDLPDPVSPEQDGALHRHWFCGTGCLRAFAADPDSYSAVSA